MKAPACPALVATTERPWRRVLYFDLLNIGACICVLYLHCNGMVHTFAPGKNWVLALAIECLFYWAVPVFFMLTGATLMKYREKYDTRTFLKKRALRTVVPFLVWSAIWYVFIYVLRRGYPFSLFNFYSMVMNNTIESIYWFFFPLFSLYLLMPVLSLLAGHVEELKYIVTVGFVLESLAPELSSILGLPWNGGLSVLSAGGNVLFVFLGYLVSTRDIPVRKRRVIYALGAFGVLFRFLYTLVLSEQQLAVNETLFSYTGFTSVMYSVAVFVWFKYHDWSKLERWSSGIARIAACSFGVYLVHYPILNTLVFGWLGVPVTSIPFRLVGALVLYLIIMLGVLVMRRVPVLRRIIP